MICGLVAHHSGSRFVAHVKGLDDALAEFEYAEDPVSDALTVADQPSAPTVVPSRSKRGCAKCWSVMDRRPRTLVRTPLVLSKGRPGTRR